MVLLGLPKSRYIIRIFRTHNIPSFRAGIMICSVLLLGAFGDAGGVEQGDSNFG